MGEWSLLDDVVEKLVPMSLKGQWDLLPEGQVPPAGAQSIAGRWFVARDQYAMHRMLKIIRQWGEAVGKFPVLAGSVVPAMIAESWDRCDAGELGQQVIDGKAYAPTASTSSLALSLGVLYDWAYMASVEVEYHGKGA